MPKKNDLSERPVDTDAKGSSLLTSEQWKLVARRLALSSRELEILQCVFDDIVESAMARRLGVSTNTAHTYMARLYRKLGVSTRCAAVTSVIRFHLKMQDSSVIRAMPDVTEDHVNPDACHMLNHLGERG